MDAAALGDPRALGPARSVAHACVQFLFRTARANVAPVPDGSHGSLTWDRATRRFQTRPLSPGGPVASLELPSLMLSVTADGTTPETLQLSSSDEVLALDWLDATLAGRGLKKAGPVRIPYDLPPDVADRLVYEPVPDLTALAAWYSFAQAALSSLVARIEGDGLHPSPIRVWPHHFDIAIYLALENNNPDPETARGVGIGLSPGDESYPQPYFYVNPWPVPKGALPDPVAPGHWHREGFTGLVATGEDILGAGPAAEEAFLWGSVAAARALLEP